MLLEADRPARFLPPQPLADRIAAAAKGADEGLPLVLLSPTDQLLMQNVAVGFHAGEFEGWAHSAPG